MKTKKNKIEGAAPVNAATNPLDSSTWTQEQVDLIKADIRAVCDAIEQGDYLAHKRAKLTAPQNQVFAKNEKSPMRLSGEVEIELDEERIEREFNQTLNAMRERWPTVADWNVIDDDHVEIEDAEGNVLAVVEIGVLDYYRLVDDEPYTEGK